MREEEEIPHHNFILQLPIHYIPVEATHLNAE